VNIASWNLNHLVVLDALLAERSVSRAGRRLGLSQPAVSNALAQLRAALGDPLFVRSGAGMIPTDRALALAEPVRGALASLESALAPDAGFDPAQARRTFVLATTDFAAFVLLPALLARLSREAPGVRLLVTAWPYHRVPPTLASGEVDLMIGFYERVPPGHAHARLLEDRFVCVVRRDHPRVRQRMTLATYLRLGHVLVSQEPNAPGVVDTVLAKRGLTRDVVLRLSHFLLVPHVIAGSDLVAALSERVARPFAELGLPLRLLPMPIAVPVGYVGMAWHERTASSRAHAWLRDVIADVARGAAAR
jgi:DNA-binding transcriptional LysR family regulator